jgi:hypothetical protein
MAGCFFSLSLRAELLEGIANLSPREMCAYTSFQTCRVRATRRINRFLLYFVVCQQQQQSTFQPRGRCPFFSLSYRRIAHLGPLTFLTTQTLLLQKFVAEKLSPAKRNAARKYMSILFKLLLTPDSIFNPNILRFENQSAFSPLKHCQKKNC